MYICVTFSLSLPIHQTHQYISLDLSHIKNHIESLPEKIQNSCIKTKLR